MNLKCLVHRELSEGLTEKELASVVGVPVRAIANILNGNSHHEPAIWEKFAQYFRMNVEFLRTGASAHAKTMVELAGSSQSAAGEIRNFPLLHWQRIGEMVATKTLPDVIHAEAMVEATDVSGTRTFALKVRDDSMEPMFSAGEMIFVNPDSAWKPGDYVIARSGASDPDLVLLRQLKHIGTDCMLHPLNRKYEDLPLVDEDDVWGKVVRLRKNL